MQPKVLLKLQIRLRFTLILMIISQKLLTQVKAQTTQELLLGTQFRIKIPEDLEL